MVTHILRGEISSTHRTKILSQNPFGSNYLNRPDRKDISTHRTFPLTRIFCFISNLLPSFLDFVFFTVLGQCWVPQAGFRFYQLHEFNIEYWIVFACTHLGGGGDDRNGWLLGHLVAGANSVPWIMRLTVVFVVAKRRTCSEGGYVWRGNGCWFLSTTCGNVVSRNTAMQWRASDTTAKLSVVADLFLAKMKLKIFAVFRKARRIWW